MPADTFHWVFYAVCPAVDDEHTAVVHLQPYVLHVVYHHVVHTVVQSADAAGNTCLVVVEVIAVKA